MNDISADQLAMLATWQQHTQAEFVLKDADAALATMTDDPYVLAIAAGTGAYGRAAVREFYASQLVPGVPPDFELRSLSQTFAAERIIEEFVLRFTHSLAMDWLVTGIPATGQKVEFAAVGVIEFRAGKIAAERLYWDQAIVLSQLGLLDNPLAAAGAHSVTRLHQIDNGILAIGHGA